MLANPHQALPEIVNCQIESLQGMLRVLQVLGAHLTKKKQIFMQGLNHWKVYLLATLYWIMLSPRLQINGLGKAHCSWSCHSLPTHVDLMAICNEHDTHIQNGSPIFAFLQQLVPFSWFDFVVRCCKIAYFLLPWWGISLYLPNKIPLPGSKLNLSKVGVVSNKELQTFSHIVSKLLLYIKAISHLFTVGYLYWILMFDLKKIQIPLNILSGI